jgi:hypothetical protein
MMKTNERFNEIYLETLPPMRVAAYRAISRTPEDDAMSVLTQWAAEAGIRGAPRNFGFDVEVSEKQQAAGMRGYELWFEVPAHVWPSGPAAVHDFPGGRYAALRLDNPFDDPFRRIPEGWGVLHEWVVTQGSDDSAERLCLEELVERDGQRDLILFHPIR